MSLAERASPPLSDGTPQGAEDARAGYLSRMSDPPSGSPVLYAGDYGVFSSPGAGSPFRGEAVSYLASWASRLSAVAGTASAELSEDASFPQPVWESGSGVAFMHGAFPSVSAGSPSLDVFRLRLLDFLRLRRAPVGVPCDQDPPPPRSWTASWDWWTSATGAERDFVPRPSGPSVDPAPSFPEACSLAGSQGAVDANGGKWVVHGDVSAGMPFGSGPGGARPAGDTDLLRFALAYMATLSVPQEDAPLRGGGFASWYVVPPEVRAESGDLVPDPSFAQEPEPLRASDMRALFADALASGRSRAWAGCSGLNLFADLGDVKTVPAVKEARWRARVVVTCLRSRGSGPADDYGGTSGWVDVGAGDAPDGAASYEWTVESAYGSVSVKWTWDGLYGSWRAFIEPVGLSYGGRGGFTDGHPFDLDRDVDPDSSNYWTTHVRLDVRVEFDRYDREVSPERTYREWGSAALPHGASFSFRSVARLEPTDPVKWYEDHPPATADEVAAWFKDNVVDYEDPSVYDFSPSPFDSVAEVWSLVTGGNPPPDPYTGRVEWANSVGKVRDLPYPDDVASLAGAGIPEGWQLGSDDMWIVGSSGDWDECYAGVNWAKHLTRDSEDGPWRYEYAPSGAPSGGDGRYDLEYVARAPAAAGVASPLCPGGAAVPVQSADSVAVRPLFCATVTVRTESVRCHSYTRSDWSVGPVEYDRLIRFHAADTEVETRYVVGFAPVPCRWGRDAGEASADATERYPLGWAGPDGLWAFVASGVLGPLGLSAASDRLGGASATYETYESARMGPTDDDPTHDYGGAYWTERYIDEHGYVQYRSGHRYLQAVDWCRVGDSVEYAEVSGTVEFPFCVFESGYCA